MPNKCKQSGQGMTEYIAIAALNAVAAIALYQSFGQTVRGQMDGIAQEVSGTSAAATINSAQTEVANAATEGVTRKGLGAYQNDNSR